MYFLGNMKFLEILLTVSAVAANIPLVKIDGNDDGTCLSQNQRQEVLHKINTMVKLALQNTNLILALECGPGHWHRVASLNMSDPAQQCPSAWSEYYNSTSEVRACRRPASSSGSCPGTIYVLNNQTEYSRVCGRAIGFQIGSPDAFGNPATSQPIDSYYVYGVSITHGTPRNHIWTYAAGVSEGGYYIKQHNCPCSDPSSPHNQFPPSFVGDDYYCESANSGNSFTNYDLYPDDPLWDGEQCEGECCSNGKSPPWFSVELPNPTTDDIEVRICIAEGSYDDVLIQILELYIQ